MTLPLPSGSAKVFDRLLAAQNSAAEKLQEFLNATALALGAEGDGWSFDIADKTFVKADPPAAPYTHEAP